MEDKEKIKIIKKKATTYLSFSSTFTGISFPLIIISLPSSIQDLLKLTVLMVSITCFIGSTIFSLITYNKSSSYNLISDRDKSFFNITFYSELIDIVYYLNIFGFLSVVLFITYVLTNHLLITILIGVFIIFIYSILRIMKGNQREVKHFRRIPIYLLLGGATFIILVVIFFLFIPGF